MIKNEILFPLHVDFDEKFMTNLQFVVEYFMKYYYDYFWCFSVLLVHKKLLVIRNSNSFYYQIVRSKSFKYNKAHHFSSDCTFIEIQRELDTFFYFFAP